MPCLCADPLDGLMLLVTEPPGAATYERQKHKTHGESAQDFLLPELDPSLAKMHTYKFLLYISYFLVLAPDFGQSWSPMASHNDGRPKIPKTCQTVLQPPFLPF